MKHLSRTELVDFIEASPNLPADRRRHAESCSDCQTEAESLREVRAAALEDGDSEPSPLFWDHFAARVAEAIRNEPAPASSTAWLRAPVIPWATAAASIVLLAVGITIWRTTLHAPAPAHIARHAPASNVPLTSPSSDADDDVDGDEAWAVVRAAAVDLNWDDVHAAGISAHPGDVENVALELSADERSELARLLNEDRKHNGV